MILPIYSDPWPDGYNVEVENWEDIPLDHFSVIAVRKFTTVKPDQMYSFLGRMNDKDWEKALEMFNKYLEKE